MHLVQVFFPLTETSARKGALARLRWLLLAKFGGVTAFTRAPAQGAWLDSDDGVDADQIVIVEAMVETLDAAWWAMLREELETSLGEEEILIRAHLVQKL